VYQGERPQSTGSKPYPRLFFFGITIGVDSCVFLIFTTRVGLKTRLNGVKSICFEQFRKFSSTISKVLVYIFVRKEAISGRCSETLWELPSIGASRRRLPLFFFSCKSLKAEAHTVTGEDTHGSGGLQVCGPARSLQTGTGSCGSWRFRMCMKLAFRTCYLGLCHTAHFAMPLPDLQLGPNNAIA
jgi:hypothetical protein